MANQLKYRQLAAWPHDVCFPSGFGGTISSDAEKLSERETTQNVTKNGLSAVSLMEKQPTG